MRRAAASAGLPGVAPVPGRSSTLGAQRPDSVHTSTAGPPGTGPAPVPTHLAGGRVLLDARHPALLPVSQLWRKLPTSAMFKTVASPLVYVLGSYQVPESTSLWIQDYSFEVLQFSGLQAGAMQAAPVGVFDSSVVFDISINGSRRDAKIHHEVVPSTPETPRLGSFTITSGTRAGYAIRRPTPGTPPPPTGFGNSALVDAFRTIAPRGGPYMLEAHAGDIVTLSFSVMRAITLPVAAIQGRFAGFELHVSLANTLLERMRPA